MNKKLFDNYNGKESYVYLLKSENLAVEICDFGARVNSIKLNGVDIALGFKSIAEILASETCAGATIGRVANRIAGGKFTLNGKSYALTCNEGKNHLHGGEGFDKKIFDVSSCSDKSIELQYKSEDGENGYPGTLLLTVKYEIKGDTLQIGYKAVCDADTLWGPTNHTYFNFDGEESGDCRKNILKLNADYYTPVNDELIPLGTVATVKGTAFDLNKGKEIGKDFNSEELKKTNGYDHNYILNGEHAARAESVKTGIAMDLYTDMPCMQLYTGGAIRTCQGKTGEYGKWAGFCLEPQFCPNAINAEGFDKPILRQGEEKRYFIRYEFSYKKGL